MASWRLPQPEGGGLGAQQGQKRTRVDDGRARPVAANSEEANIKDMLARVQKLSLQSAQAGRATAGSLWTTCLAPSTLIGIPEAKAAGARYHEATVGKKAHGLGPPHLHLFAAFLEAQANLPQPDRLFLDKFIKGIINDKAKLTDLVLYFKLRDTRGPPRKNDPKQGESSGAKEAEQPQQTVINFHLNPLTVVELDDLGGVLLAARLRKLILDIIVTGGGTLAEGAAPPGQLERSVQADLHKLLR